VTKQPPVYNSDRAALIRQARSQGLNNEQIVKKICENRAHEEVRGLAKVWAPLLDLTETNFYKIARCR
jgi:hypothetical protein